MKPRILIVEDDPYMAQIIAGQITELGYHPVATCAYGEEAVELAGKLPCDLALVDLRLAGEMDGIETASLLREKFSVPSVLITAAPDQKQIERAIESQPYGYLTKPFTALVLRLSVEMALQRLRTESALREQEEQLQAVLRTSMDSFWIFGLDGRVLDVNDTACRMTGFSREELLQMNLFQLEYERTLDQISEGIEYILQNGSAQIERVTRRKDGQLRVIEMSVTCSPPPQRRLYCFGRDVTDRRHNEQALRESERNLRATLDSIPDAATLKDNDGRYLDVNPAWCKMYGPARDAVVGKTDADLFPAEQATRYRQRDDLVRKSLEPLCVTVEHKQETGTVWLEVRKTPFFDADRRCAGLVSITRDITERHRSELALKDSEHNLRSALDNLPDAAWLKDRDGRYLAVNAAWCKLNDQSPASVIGKTDFDLFAMEDAREYAQRDEAVRRSGVLTCAERNYKSKGNGIVQLEVRKTPLIDSENQPSGLVGTARDVTERNQAQKVLEEQLALRERLSKIAANAPGIIYTFRLRPDGSSCLPYASPTIETFFGVRAEDLVEDASALFDLVHPADLVQMRETIAMSARTLSPWRAEFRLHHPQKGSFWVEGQSTPERQADGSVLWHGFMSDITKRKQTEEVLRTSEERLRMALQAGRLGAFEHILSTNQILPSPEYCEIFGLSLRPSFPFDESLGRICPDDLNRVGAAVQQMIVDRTAIDIEIRICLPTGDMRWIRAMVSPVVENGKVDRLHGVIQDITERKLAEAELRKLSQAVEQSPASIVITDPLGKIVYVNPYFERTTGYTSAEAIGQNPRILKTDDQSQSFYKDLWQTITSGREWRGEFCNKRKDGSRYWEQASISAVRNEQGSIVQFIAVKEDITDRKREQEELVRAKDEAESANRAKSAFLATMSHELRTPLNVINGMSAILSQENWPPEHKHAIDLISEGGHALLNIIEEILDFSGLQAGKTKLEETPFSLATVIGSALRLCAASAQVKGLILTCSLDPKMPSEVLGDSRRLRQILVNLLQNAIKFTERGRIHFRTTVRAATSNTYTLEYSIFDSGIGIAEESLKKLFLPFTQADASITRRFGGTGLGLAITKSFVNLMGGDISVRSRTGLGSVFRFRINLKATERRTAAFICPATQGLQKRRVLVLGGRGAQQRMLETLIRSWGMLATVVQSSQPKTCAAYQDTGYDIAILPIQDMADPNQPIFSWLAEPGRGAKLPVVWLGRKDATPPTFCTAPSVRLGTLVEPVELSQALSDLFSAASANSARRDRKADKPRPLAEILPLTILAAEDNATNREVIKLVLRSLGYQVDLVENGAEAVIAVKNKKYDLLLLDMQMPIMDGLTAAREICRLIPDPARRLKIIALTANALPGDRERCLEAGMDSYLTKPILPNDLSACLRRVFQPGEGTHPIMPQKVATKAAPSDNPWVDTHHLETIVLGLQPDQALSTLRQLHASVVNDYNATFPTVIECCEHQDQAHFAETIHGLKGCFMMIGWNRVAVTCAEALVAARKGEFTDWQAFPGQLKAAFEYSSNIMAGHLEKRNAAAQISDPAEPSASTEHGPFSR